MLNELRKAVSALSSSKADRLLAHLARCKTLRDVTSWIEKNT
jgi:hypothetical protein